MTYHEDKDMVQRELKKALHDAGVTLESRCASEKNHLRTY